MHYQPKQDLLQNRIVLVCRRQRWHCWKLRSSHALRRNGDSAGTQRRETRKPVASTLS